MEMKPWMHKVNYKLVQDPEEFRAFLSVAQKDQYVAIDTETTGLNPEAHKIVGISVSTQEKLAIYIPIRHVEGANLNMQPEQAFKILNEFKDEFIWLMHNKKFDMAFFEQEGVFFSRVEDTMINHFLHDSNDKQIGLKDVSKKALGIEMVEITDLFEKKGRKKVEIQFHMVHPKEALFYAAADADMTLRIHNKFAKTREDQPFIYRIENKVIDVIRRLENNRVKLDIPYLEDMRIRLQETIQAARQEIWDIAGYQFEIDSPKQLGIALFDKVQIAGKGAPGVKRTANGQYATGEDDLYKYRDVHPLVAKVVRYKKLTKYLGSYVETPINAVDSKHEVKLSFRTIAAPTGRFASGAGGSDSGYAGINAQGIPKVYEDSEWNIRKAFIARPGYLMLALDYSGEELRAAANLSGERVWLDSFKRGEDVHANTAKVCFGVKEPSKHQRQMAKSGNFGLVYGGSAYTLANTTKIPIYEAEDIFYKWWGALKTLKAWQQREVIKSRQSGYTFTYFGRRRTLNGIKDKDWKVRGFWERTIPSHQVQGCLQGDSRIFTNLGIIKIKDLYSLSKPLSIKVWDGDLMNNFSVLNRGPAQLADVELSNGMILKCDVRHEVLSFNEQGYFFKHFSELKIGDNVCVSPPFVLDGIGYPETPITYLGKSSNSKTIKVESENQWNFIAYLMGYVLGDGNLVIRKNVNSIRGTIQVVFGRNDLETNLVKIQEGLLGFGLNTVLTKCTGSRGDAWKIRIDSTPLCKLFLDFGFVQAGSRLKRIPDQVFKMPLKMRVEFLRGYFDSDGCKKGTDNCCGFHTPNHELLLDVQLLGWSLGLYSRVYRTGSKTSKLTWSLVNKFKDLMGINKEENSYLRAAGMNAPTFLADKFYKLLPKYKWSEDKIIYGYLNRLRTGRSVSIPVMVEVLNSLGLDTSGFYYYFPIKSINIREEEEVTYTLSVDNSKHQFVSDGVISKNTCADIMKIALIKCDDLIRSNGLEDKIKMLMTIHDEILFEVREDFLVEAIPLMKSGMEFEIKGWEVPMIVDAKIGPSWGEMVDEKKWFNPPDPDQDKIRSTINETELAIKSLTSEQAQNMKARLQEVPGDKTVYLLFNGGKIKLPGLLDPDSLSKVLVELGVS